MPRKRTESEPHKRKEKIIEIDLPELMRDNFLEYAKSTILERALPQEDGLKPVQRKILYAMHERGLSSNGRYTKCAGTVGFTLSNFHAHGDTSVYDALVILAQDWKKRYPLIDFSGNVGDIDGSPAAAYRYTEHKLSPYGEAILEGLQYDTVDMVSNFDNTRMEPSILPGIFCNLLLNGCDGIATGMATSMLPHYAGDIYKAIDYILGEYLEKKNPNIDKVIKIVKAPDFPTGGIIMNPKDIPAIYKNGKGRIVVRSTYHIEKDKKKKEHIVFTEIPFGANKASIVESIFRLAPEGVSDIRDESNRNGIRIVLDLKANADQNSILNILFKKTGLESGVSMNNVMIQGGKPKENCNLLFLLETVIKQYATVKFRKTKFLLNKALSKLEIVEGLIKCYSQLQMIMTVIRNTNSTMAAIEKLVSEFDFTHNQAKAITDKKLGSFNEANIAELKEEQKNLLINIKSYQELIKDPIALLKSVKEDYKAFAKTSLFKGDHRRTRIAEMI
jgi:DNA gyrase/topoisomerase IV subunit A